MNFFERIADLNYVVQRGFDGLPDNLELQADLDLFCDVKDVKLLEEVVQNALIPIKVDIRYKGDGYYPDYICDKLLEETRELRGVRIPSAEAYFLALFYHSQVHGREQKYIKELKRAFLEWLPPVKPEDEGVKFDPA